jgi:hypothetical protein
MNTPDTPEGKLAASRVQLRQALRQSEAASPLQTALHATAASAGLVLQPVARAHPYRLVIGAAVVGALLARTRPWRWLSASAVLAGLMPQLVHLISGQLEAKD